MTQNFHDAIDDTTILDTTGLGQRLSDLDTQITKGFNGAPLGVFSALAITSGVAIQTSGRHALAAESGTADVVHTITPITGAQFLYVQADAGDTIVLENGVGNLDIGRDIVLTGDTYAMLYYTGSEWILFSTNAQRLALPYAYLIGFDNSVTGTANCSIAPGYTYGVLNGIFIDAPSGSLDVGVSGIGGLDTGSIAANTMYAIYVVIGSSGINYLMSANVTTPTLPAGYNWDYRRVGWVRTNNISQFYRQKMYGGGAFNRTVRYTDVSKAAPYLIADDVNLGNGAGSATTMDFQGMLPQGCRRAICLVGCNTASAAADIFWYVNSLSVFLGSLTTAHGYWAEHVLEVSGGFGAAYGDTDDEDFSLVQLGYEIDLWSDTP